MLMRERILCAGCLKSVNHAYQTHNFSGNQIKQEFKKNCSKLSFFDRIMCYKFVNKHKNQIVFDLKQNKKPDQICKSLNLCRNI